MDLVYCRYKAGAVEEADAVEIFADKPTADL